ncbi:MAG: aminotransferase class I/II-fold pyridoxal phosphate-dependent enzyme [Microcystaceae cyanobacterium]
MNQFSQHPQNKLPIVSILHRLAHQPDAAFYVPGHKRGQRIPESLAQLGKKGIFKADLPELPELDNLFAPEGVILEAQELAAQAFGSEQTWFLVNGSSSGIMAAILATCRTGDTIILPRNIHRSAIAGLILSGANPIFLAPEYDPRVDLVGSVTPEALEATLKAYPNTKAVFLLHPTYQGICGDLRQMAEITHRYNIPLLVDEAHGGHFAFHDQLPPSALSCGADLTIQSTHKVLGAMTQASMVHLQGNRVEAQRVNQGLQWVQTTSPSYLLLASLDAARQQMAMQGQELLRETIELSRQAREALSQIQGILTIERPQSSLGFYDLDITRLTVDVSGLGLTGYEADDILRQKYHVTAELPLLRHLTFIISIGNTQSDINSLINAFRSLKSSPASPAFPAFPASPASPSPLPISPREAAFSSSISQEIEKSIGLISAEVICPYPPGIPVLITGERITREAIDYLQLLKQQGAMITGCSDPTLKTVKVLMRGID